MALIQTDPNRQGNGLTNALQGGVRKACPVYNPANAQPRDPELSTHGLPKAFLHSLRTLFDILDDGGRGYIQLSEIESRWRGAEERDVPAGVLEGLRRVASRHGRLSFERFVAGLRYSMFNPENCSKTQANNPRQQQNPPERSRTGTGRLLECRVRPLGPSNGTNTVHSRNRPDKHSYCSRYSVRSDPAHTEHHGRPTEPASGAPDGLTLNTGERWLTSVHFRGMCQRVMTGKDGVCRCVSFQSFTMAGVFGMFNDELQAELFKHHTHTH